MKTKPPKRVHIGERVREDYIQRLDRLVEADRDRYGRTRRQLLEECIRIAFDQLEADVLGTRKK